MLLDVIKEENLLGQSSEELTRTLNDISQQNTSLGNLPKAKAIIAAAAATTITSNALAPHDRKFSFGERKFSFGERRSSFNFRLSGKTEKDKYNSKERRNSRYFVRSGDKEAIQCRANSLKRAINTVMEHSGLYDQKTRRGSRKYSITALNIPENISTKSDVQLTPPLIIEPTASFGKTAMADDTIITNLSPLPEQRRTSMDEFFFNGMNLPVPKQFADSSSRRSSGVTEPIKEEEANGHFQMENMKIIGNEHNYDVGYLCSPNGSNCESAVPYEVYERNLLRASIQHQQNSPTLIEREVSMKSDDGSKLSPHTLQVPMITMSDVDMMERNLLCSDNVYTSENLTIIDTDNAVRKALNTSFFANPTNSHRQTFLFKDQSLSEDIGAVEASDILSAISNEECSVTSEILDKHSSGNAHINAIEEVQVIYF